MLRKDFYKHVITACAFLLMFVNVGFPSTSFGVYQPYIVNSPEMTHATGSLVITFRNFVSLLAIFWVHKYYEKFNCKIGISLATLLTAIGFFIYSISNNLILYLIGAVVVGAGYGFGGSAAMTILIGQWYKKDTGVPIGIATIGSSISGIFIPVIALTIVNTVGLSMSFMIEGIIALISSVLLFFFLKNKNQGNIKLREKEILPAKRIIDKRKYTLFVFSVFLVGGACLSAVVFLSILFTTSGSSALLAATVVSVSNIALCIGKFILGFCFDKIGTYKSSIIFYVIVIVSVILLCIAPEINEVFAIVAASIFGVGTSILTVGISQWSIVISVESSRQRTIRDFQAAYAAGGFAMGMIPGAIAEVFESYLPFYISVSVIIAISAIMFIVLFPKNK